VRQLVASVKEELDDDELIEKLRQVRNIFAKGGADLAFDANELGSDCMIKMMSPLLANFVETGWVDGLKLLFQIIFNSAPFFANEPSFVALYFSPEKMTIFLDKLTVFDTSQVVSGLLCACLYNECRLGKAIVDAGPLVLHCMRHCINDPDGWAVLLLTQLYKRRLLVDYCNERILAEHGDELCSIVEFLVDHVRSAESDMFDQGNGQRQYYQTRDVIAMYIVCFHH